MTAPVEEALAVLRAQRHSFLNHVQVVAGLLQLNKPQRALEYLRDIQPEFEDQGRLLRLGVPAVALAIMAQAELARRQNTKVALAVETDLAGLRTAAADAAAAARLAWRAALALAGANGRIRLAIQAAPAGFTLGFRVTPGTDGLDPAPLLADLRQHLSNTEGRYTYDPEAYELVVHLV